MLKYPTKLFIFLLDNIGEFLINWTVKSKDDQAFLPEEETANLLTFEN